MLLMLTLFIMWLDLFHLGSSSNRYIVGTHWDIFRRYAEVHAKRNGRSSLTRNIFRCQKSLAKMQYLKRGNNVSKLPEDYCAILTSLRTKFLITPACLHFHPTRLQWFSILCKAYFLAVFQAFVWLLIFTVILKEIVLLFL